MQNKDRIHMLLAGLLASSMLFSTAAAQSNSSATPPAPAAKPVAGASVTRYRPNRAPKREREYYEVTWGVDSLVVKSVESGELIRFSYRVVEPTKAKVLNDKKYTPSLIDERAHVKLVVPSMEKVGQLRQATTPEAGKVYWMVFSNKGRPVKVGDQVDIEIGTFHARGLTVQ